MPHPIVFFDIAGPDDTTLKDFYMTVFGWDIDRAGQFSVAVAGSLDGAIRRDPAEKRLYIGTPDVTATLRAVAESGGTIEEERFEAPGIVVLGLFRDPAGNAMGLVEMDGDSPRIP